MKNRGIGHDDLAKAVGLKTRSVRYWSKGEVVPSYEVLARVHKVLGINSQLAMRALGLIEDDTPELEAALEILDRLIELNRTVSQATEAILVKLDGIVVGLTVD